MIDSPSLFHTLYKFIKPFMDPVTANKLSFVNSKDKEAKSMFDELVAENSVSKNEITLLTFFSCRLPVEPLSLTLVGLGPMLLFSARLNMAERIPGNTPMIFISRKGKKFWDSESCCSLYETRALVLTGSICLIFSKNFRCCFPRCIPKYIGWFTRKCDMSARGSLCKHTPANTEAGNYVEVTVRTMAKDTWRNSPQLEKGGRREERPTSRLMCHWIDPHLVGATRRTETWSTTQQQLENCYTVKVTKDVQLRKRTPILPSLFLFFYLPKMSDALSAKELY